MDSTRDQWNTPGIDALSAEAAMSDTTPGIRNGGIGPTISPSIVG